MDALAAKRREQLSCGPVAWYRRAVEIRTLENSVVQLFADGHIHGTTHTCQGQEALAVALAAAVTVDDVVCCTYRGHGIALALGMSPDVVLGEIMGRRSGCMSGLGGSMHLSDPAIGLLPTFAIVGAGIPVGAGAALAFQVRGENRVAISVFGDGASNIGAFHEGLNLAAVWRLPAVFICDNNLYGEYSRIDKTTSVERIADRAVAYGIPAESVDGMDVYAVKAAISRARARALAGAGPTLLEVLTYRFAGHSRADQATYRPDGELEEWRRRDPVLLMRKVALDGEHANEAELDAIDADVEAEISVAIQAAFDAGEPTIADLERFVWAEPMDLRARA